MRVLAPVLAVLTALFAFGCGSSSSSDSSTASTSTASTGSAQAASVSHKKKTKPKVTVPKGPPPTKLVIKEIEKGTGAAAKAGDEVTVQYVGVSYKTGKQFDASWDRHEPFTFPLGEGQVIPGWDAGVAGMRVGGRRELIIPPKLAYGAAGEPPAIAPNETLIFVIDLLKVS